MGEHSGSFAADFINVRSEVSATGIHYAEGGDHAVGCLITDLAKLTEDIHHLNIQ